MGGINIEYYTGKVEQVKAVIALIGSLKEILLPILQMVEDMIPDAKGSDKLKAAMNFVKSAVADNEELSAKLDTYWTTFTGAVSAFVVAQKALGGIVVKK